MMCVRRGSHFIENHSSRYKPEHLHCWSADYPGLEGTALVEEYRRQILCTFRAYTTGLNHDIPCMHM